MNKTLFAALLVLSLGMVEQSYAAEAPEGGWHGRHGAGHGHGRHHRGHGGAGRHSRSPHRCHRGGGMMPPGAAASEAAEAAPAAHAEVRAQLIQAMRDGNLNAAREALVYAHTAGHLPALANDLERSSMHRRYGGHHWRHGHRHGLGRRQRL